jgi:PAS domain S-box-containing protein
MEPNRNSSPSADHVGSSGAVPPQGIVLVDARQADYPITFVSPGFESLTGYSAAEVLGRNCRLLQGPDTDRATVAELRHALERGEAVSKEILNYRKDGSAFWNQLSIVPLHSEAGTTQLLGVLTDVTRTRELEERLRQAEKMEAIATLAAGIAHDFNSMLTVIDGYSDLLLEALESDSPLREMVTEIRQAGQRSAELTGQLLAFSGQQVAVVRRLDLNSLIRRVKGSLREMVGEDIALITRLQSDLWRVMADPAHMEQALQHLCANARDAMPAGGSLRIETRNADADGRREVLLTVSDTGCGVPKEMQSRLFEPFFTTKPPGQGTGLGLSTVFGIVAQAGGRIELSSEVDVGSCFTLVLQAAEEELGKPSGLARPQSRPSTETVMVVEDEGGLRALASRVLAKNGYTVLEAQDGKCAARLLREHAGPIHLLLTDVVMPEMGGPEVAALALARDPSTRVLYMSGYTSDSVVRRGVSRDEVQFLPKPFSPSQLIEKVRQVLDKPDL